MSTRATVLGAKGVVVQGRVRDLAELNQLGFPTFSTGQSVLGAKPELKLKSCQEPIVLAENTNDPVTIKQGDLIVADEDGVVRVPVDLVEKVLETAALLTEQDQKCLKDIQGGVSIQEAFKRHR